MPLISRTFDQLIDFTRTTAATYVNSAGLVTLTPPSVNLLLYTQEFDNPAWTKTAAAVIPNQNPAAASLGFELISNGDFASSAGWTTGTGWSIGSGVASTTTGSGTLDQNITLVGGRLYQITYTISGWVSGQAIPGFSGGTVVNGPASAAANGTYTAYITANAGNTTFRISKNASADTFSVDNISVREVVGGFITAPDGTSTADALIESAVTNVHGVQQSLTLTATAYTLSVYLKAQARTWAQVLNGTIANGFAYFDLATGVVGTVGAGVSATSITDAGNGWYRCSITFPAATGGNILAVRTASANNTANYTGDGTSGISIWGAQLEAVPDANLVLGPDLVTNGDFSGGSTGWTPGTGWAIASGVATFTANSTNSPLYNTATAPSTAGKTYRVEYTVVANTLNVSALRAGGFTGSSFFGATTTTLPAVVGTNVAYVYVTAPSGTGVTLDFWVTNAATSGALTLDNISVKEFTGVTAMPSAYAKNVGGLFPARFDYDPVTLAPRGILIEEQRTNILTYSEQFNNVAWTKNATGTASLPAVTPNAATAPDGTNNADLVVFDRGAGNTLTDRSFIFQGPITIPNATAYTGTCYMKAATVGDVGKQLAIRNVGNSGYTIITLTNSWQRVGSTETSTSTSGNLEVANRGTLTADNSVSVLLYGAQLEAGAFATSYIPTVASTVTRTADVASVTAANFSSWYNQPSGTFVVDYDSFAATIPPSTKGLASANDNTGNNRVYGYLANNGAPTLLVTNGGATEANPLNSVISNNAITKSAWGYAANNFAIITNGGAAATDTSGTPPTAPNKLDIGHHLAGQQINGYIRSIRYYPARLNNAQLQTLTA